jgi:hypothetical protein
MKLAMKWLDYDNHRWVNLYELLNGLYRMKDAGYQLQDLINYLEHLKEQD